MWRERIIACFVLSICLVWAAEGQARSASGESQHTGTLAERFSGWKKVFQKDDSKSQKTQPSVKANATSQSKSSQLNQHAQSSHSSKSSSKSFLPKINAGNLVPGGLFSNLNRNSNQQQHAQQSVARRGSSSPKTAESRKSEPSKPSAESARVARRSSNLDARRNELESALSDLLETPVALDDQALDTPTATEPREPSDSPKTPAIPEPTVSNEQGSSNDRVETRTQTQAETQAKTQAETQPHEPLQADSDDGLEDIAARLDTSRTATAAMRKSQHTHHVQATEQQGGLDLRSALLGNAFSRPKPSSETKAPSKPTPAAAPSEDSSLDSLARGFQGANASESRYSENRVTEERAAQEVEADMHPTPPVGNAEAAALPAESAGSAYRAGEESRSLESLTLGSDNNLRSSQDSSAVADSRNVLLSYKQPVIVSQVQGPSKILVGREAKYRVTLRNLGDTDAESLVATIAVPEWAEFIDANSSRGIVQTDAGDSGLAEGQSLQWQLQRLKAHGTQTLDLSLVPHSGRALQLGVNWVHAPVGTEAIVEVQEPKLELAIDGPSDVLFEKPTRYRLTLSNPGTGAAEQVTLKLLPPGGDASSVTTHVVGPLEPGVRKVIELELTPREAGDLQIKASAEALGDLRTEVVKQLACRKPELEIDWRGPSDKYAGTTSTYYFRLRNPGTAATEPLVCTFQLPKGVKLVGASKAGNGRSFDKKQNKVTWKLAGLKPQEKRFLRVECQLDKPGLNVMPLVVQTASGGLRDGKTVQTNVVALADLKLEVADPKGPLPVGESAIYEIHVVNRGTSSAEGVNIVALFSEGIDPTAVEGAPFAIRDGRVSFRTFKNLPAGDTLVLRIRAEASQPGTHIFRAEVTCEDLDIKLAAEETTRFFKDEFHWDEGETPYTAERQSEDWSVTK